jgi:hypothetical protein
MREVPIAAHLTHPRPVKMAHSILYNDSLLDREDVDDREGADDLVDIPRAYPSRVWDSKCCNVDS